ncbi:putative lipase [Fuerstiella marisgermanici]|uniref:Putative lipase n=2 Tax=Fuerstiella marisgermanici TaxID=1891926 RepID=A0A1P8WGW7_9PLAN|nr:putative lipase [Fuerstiella marisgermanici]
MGTVGILCVVAGFGVCLASTVASTPKTTYLRLGLAFVLLVAGCWLSRMAPYIACFGIAFVVVSALRFLNPIASKTARVFGSLATAAALLTIALRLFQSPTDSGTEIGEGGGLGPTHAEEKTPLEILAMDWSSKDPNCHWSVSKLMLDLCEIAYAPPVEAREQIAKLGFDSESINAGSMQGYVVDAGDDSIVVLRGTESHEYDILQDLRFLESEEQQGAMHGGFVKGYKPMHSQVISLLERYETKRVWITGHSLGGGLAIVCAFQLVVKDEYPIAGVMTFGQPKVVEGEMLAFLEPRLAGKYVFFVNDMDPVPRLIDPYLHFGHMVRWTDDEIVRSRRIMLVGNNENVASEPQLEAESGYVEPMSDADLELYIERIGVPQGPRFDQNGNPMVQGVIPSGTDHKLSAYSAMLESIRRHSTAE